MHFGYFIVALAELGILRLVNALGNMNRGTSDS
jgi:hypothetical protein